MKANIFPRAVIRVMFVIFTLFVLNACTKREISENGPALNPGTESPGEEKGSGRAWHGYVLYECGGDCVELLLPGLWAKISGIDKLTLAYLPKQDNIGIQGQIRVFENGNANIRLFPDRTFIANLFHNTKITGTYTEMTDRRETAVLFSGQDSSSEASPVTVVGGIVDGVLTIPEDWDDSHGHGMDFAYRAYPLVFIGEGGQRIILRADNSFEANFANDAVIIGFYGIRATSATFAPGSPTFDRNGTPVGTFLLAELRICGGDPIDNLGHGDDDDCDIEPTASLEPDDENDNDSLDWCDECQEWH